ncbi:MAG: glycosyltransferase family 4 protein [Anaerolineae bacterium]|nr:glycosyltransferase family 4 protein [Anaerolineae bacterium]
MHLVINASDLGRARGGNESYLLGLIAGLASTTGRAGRSAVRVSLIAAHEGVDLARLAAGPQRPGLPCRDGLGLIDAGPYRRLPFFLWQQTAILRRLRPDWYLSTFFLPPVTPCRAAVLIHDLSFRAHPGYYPLSIAAYMRLLTGLAIRRAEVVLALSEFTRGEIARFYPAAADKVTVAYPGVGAEFHPDAEGDDQALAALGVRRPYVLAVGNIHPRKNLGRLLDAWLRLPALTGEGSWPLPALAWAGLDRWGSDDLIRRAREAGVQLIGFVPAAHLPALYRQAEALVYPSLYEGFGLPPLEAMACGTPVLAANTTSLPEAVGDAAMTVDPMDVGALAEGLAQILFDGALRRDLRARGLARAAEFRWERTAERLLDVLDRAAC